MKYSLGGDEPVEVPITRALDPEVVNAVWTAVEGLIPPRIDSHPLGCHRRRIPDRTCFEGILIRLATGCSWEDTERLMRVKPHEVAETREGRKKSLRGLDSDLDWKV